VRLILASASPRRAELLTTAGYAFDVHAVHVNERHLTSEPAATYVKRLAAEKSARALEEILEEGQTGDAPNADGPGGMVVLGADTAVIAGHEILGKPRDAEDAARMLRRLSGRTHEVMTGVSLRSTATEVTHVEVTTVEFASLTEDQIAWYVASGEGTDKAGGYGIQGLASRFVVRIDGSYANVVGLPIAVIDGLIRRLSWPPGVLASRG